MSTTSQLYTSSGSGKLSRAERRRLAEQEAQQRISTELQRSKPIDVTGKPTPSLNENRGAQKAALTDRAEQILLKAEVESRARVDRLKQEKLDDYHKLVASSETFRSNFAGRDDCETESTSSSTALDSASAEGERQLMKNSDKQLSGQESSTDSATILTTEEAAAAISTALHPTALRYQRHGSIGAVAAMWEKRVHDYQDKQTHNPFSDKYIDTGHMHKGDEGYGKPLQGSATDERGKQAHVWVDEEIEKLKERILQLHRDQSLRKGAASSVSAATDGNEAEADKVSEVMKGGTTASAVVAVKFRDLFSAYQELSNSVVGILRRAQSRGVVRFEGRSAADMLYQGTDDDILIELLQLS